MVLIDEWGVPNEQSYIYPREKDIILNIAKFIPKSARRILEADPDALKAFETFSLERTAFQNKANDLCTYIDYFIENYDPDKELPMIYMNLKQSIDDGKYMMTPIEFQKLMYRRIFSGSKIRDHVYKMVEDNYNIDVTIDSKTGRHYDSPDDFTNDDVRRLLAVSTIMKIVVPPSEHFISTSEVYRDSTIKDLIVEIFNEVFYRTANVGDVELDYLRSDFPGTLEEYLREYNKGKPKDQHLTMKGVKEAGDDMADSVMLKIYKFVTDRLRKHAKNNQTLWVQQAALRGVTEQSHSDQLLVKFIFYDNFFKFKFNENIVSFLQSVTSTQLHFTIEITKYKKDPIRIDNIKGSEGLSSIDKVEQSMVKIDETEVVRTDISLEDTIDRLEREVGPIDDDEIEYYGRYLRNTNVFRCYLLENYFAKEFNGFSELKSMPDRSYLKLTIIAKRRLKKAGFKQLPWLISAITQGKVSNRLLQNTKYTNKLKQSQTFQHIMDDNYPTLQGYNDNVVLEVLSKVLNNVYCFVEYEQQELTGEIIDFNEDIISDELMNFIDNV